MSSNCQGKDRRGLSKPKVQSCRADSCFMRSRAEDRAGQQGAHSASGQSASLHQACRTPLGVLRQLYSVGVLQLRSSIQEFHSRIRSVTIERIVCCVAKSKPMSACVISLASIRKSEAFVNLQVNPSQILATRTQPLGSASSFSRRQRRSAANSLQRLPTKSSAGIALSLI